MTKEQKAKAYLSTPEGFATGVLGFDLHEWQKDIVNEFDDLNGRSKVACSTPNGAGKSSKVIATIILRTICTKPQARVIVTSADSRQLDAQIWPALIKHRDKFSNEWVWREHDRTVITPQKGFAYMFTTDNAGRAEGWHCEFSKDTDSPVVIIVDEAKSVQEPIFDALSARCTFNGLLYISSTGLMQGSFYEAMCGRQSFKRYAIGLDQCPHISKQRIEELKEEYKDAPDHPLFRSTLYGEFMDFTGDKGRFISVTDINNCIKSPPVGPKEIPYRGVGDCVAFCDFAGGGAENVLAIRRGKECRLIRCWKEQNEMAAIGDFITMFRSEGLEAHQIWGDNAGAGKPMIARFHEVGWPINRFNGQLPAFRETEYADKNAEVWETGGRDIKAGKVVIPDDPKLHRQMTSRNRTADSRGRIKCEPKDEMLHKRGVESPDRADAIMAVIALKPVTTLGKGDNVIFQSWKDYLHDHKEQDIAYNIPGAGIGR
jgi:phage terminase large subunit